VALFLNDEQCFEDCDDFMLGNALLVAPVSEEGATRRSVYRPAGPQAWFDFHSGERFSARQIHTVDAPWSSLPLFACAGASIPLAGAGSGRRRHDDPVTDTRLFRA